jgi:hypothetical protein
MQFSNTTSETGIVQETLKICKATVGKYPLKDIARRVNAGMVRAFRIGFLITGDASLDDDTRVTLPISYQNLVSGLNAYPVSGFSGTFTNFIKLEARDSGGNSQILTEENVVELNFLDKYTTSDIGNPTYFVKVGGTYYVRPTPNYNYTNGLAGFGNRKPDFFVSTDTTKESPYWLPEFYLARYAAQPYLEENGMQNAQSNYQHILEDEQEIRDYWVRMSKNTRPKFSALNQNNK